MTLSRARLAALFEADAKKLVALSTLSQLGLMVVSLSVRTKFICLLHVLRHAFAKANLFMVVGNVMHFHYSSQESRAISFSGVKFFVFSSFVRIVRLSGLLFSAGFYSKEAILSFRHSLVRSLLLLVFLLGIICLTFLYSYKLLSVLLVSFSKVMSSVSSVLSSIPRVFMVTLVLLVGYYFCKNLGSVVGVSLLSSTILL
jgi:NADH:ubiquinone oxidoreductase subunit 5 (subunit L)/multisubunit Na+/H+ antiporter MnhA subunit